MIDKDRLIAKLLECARQTEQLFPRPECGQDASDLYRWQVEAALYREIADRLRQGTLG